MRGLMGAVVLSVALFVQAPWAWADAIHLAQATGGTSASGVQGKGALGAVQVRGTVEAVDKEQRTVTLKGPRGRVLTLAVQDPQKLEAIKVGDPVVAVYVEAVVIRLNKSGTGGPTVTTRETRASSKPGETPAGAIG